MTVKTQATPISVEQVWEALRDVDDPEMPISIVDLGMVYDVRFDRSGKIMIDLGLTATACPAVDFIYQDIRERLAREEIQPRRVPQEMPRDGQQE